MLTASSQQEEGAPQRS